MACTALLQRTTTDLSYAERGQRHSVPSVHSLTSANPGADDEADAICLHSIFHSAGSASSALMFTTDFVKRKTSQIFEAVTALGNGHGQKRPMAEDHIDLATSALIDTYEKSEISKKIRKVSEELQRNGVCRSGRCAIQWRYSSARGIAGRRAVNVNVEGRNRTSYATQFTILSGRVLKNPL